MNKSNVLQADRDFLIHPVSGFHAHQQTGPVMLASAQGPYLTDIAGHTALDAFSGLWCVNVGYGQESVIAAAQAQMSRLPYATGYFGFSCEPAALLAERLVQLTPASLQHVFFTLGGSDADDSAIRYVTHYYNSIGRPTKKHFISLERGYHGSSSTGAGLTALPAFHQHFDLPLAHQHTIPSPYAYRHPERAGPEQLISESVAALEARVAELGADRVAAFFCEPVQGSGGVIVPPVGWLKAMEQACRALDILFVVDEVITGFGRTGPLFACEAEQVEPDLLILAKGLTSGYAPMGAVMMNDKVFSGIAGSGQVVGHGYTYSAHPVSAAVALEVLRLYTDGGVLAQAQTNAPLLRQGLENLRDHPLVGEVRCRGMLGAVELVADKASRRALDPALGLSGRISRIAYGNKLIFRAFADGILGFAPALNYLPEQFECLFERLGATLDQLLDDPDIRQTLS
jgi:adenosylmethionine-8-amino-7-oxononanoate aminotransferase